MAIQSIADGAKIAFRGFSELQDPILGKVVSYLTPIELENTARVSKKMQQIRDFIKLELEINAFRKKITQQMAALKIPFRGFIQLEDPVLGKVVSYLTPVELQITACVSKKMHQIAAPKANIKTICIRFKMLKDIGAVEKLIKRGHIQQAIQSADPIFDKFAKLEGSLVKFQRPLPGLLEGVSSIAFGIVKSLIDRGEIDGAVKVAKMIFDVNLHDELFSCIVDKLIMQNSIESLKKAFQITHLMFHFGKNKSYIRICLQLMRLRDFEFAAQVASKVGATEDVCRLRIYVDIVKGLKAQYKALRNQVDGLRRYECKGGEAHQIAARADQLAARADQIAARTDQIVDAIPYCDDFIKKAILNGNDAVLEKFLDRYW